MKYNNPYLISCGVIIGASLLVSHVVSANKIEVKKTAPTISTSMAVTDDQTIEKIENHLKIKELNRYESSKNTVIYGTNSNEDGGYFTYNKWLKTFSNGVDTYYLHDGKILNASEHKIDSLKNTILPNIAGEYGFVLGGSGSKIAYILADTTCIFSRKFFVGGGASRLMDQGYKVIVIPMSRKVEQNELVGLSAFNCNLTQNEKRIEFIKAIDGGHALLFPMKKSTGKCSYWGGLKALYSIFTDYDLKGFPAVIKSDSKDIEYSFEPDV